MDKQGLLNPNSRRERERKKETRSYCKFNILISILRESRVCLSRARRADTYGCGNFSLRVDARLCLCVCVLGRITV